MTIQDLKSNLFKSEILNPTPTLILPLPLGGGGYRRGRDLEHWNLGFCLGFRI